MPLITDLPSSGARNSNDEESQIQNFFNGRSVFITGVSGFLGTVILTTLLRYCPGLEKAYVLLREKKGVDFETRKDKVMSKKILCKLKEWDKEILNKVTFVRGDVTEDDLGIRPSEMLELIENVSVVFNSAAVVHFNRPLSYMILQNVCGTENVVKFCRKLKGLVSFVHVSTAFSSCNKHDVYEVVPELNFTSKEFIEAARRGDDEKLAEMSQRCTPPWPNTYTLSKAIAEDMLLREAADLPTAIIRPSIVISAWKGVLPGYVEEGSGLMDLSVAVGKGFARVLFCNPDNVMDIIPADIAINTILTAAWYIFANKPHDLFIVNCVSSCSRPVKYGYFVGFLFDLQKSYPLPNMYQIPGMLITKHWIVYWACSLVNHYVPALFLDFVLIMMGKKARLTKLYVFYDKCMSALSPFIMNEWNFHCHNYDLLVQHQNSKDKELFYIEFLDSAFEEICYALPQGSPLYDWSKDKRKLHERLEIAYKRYLITSTVKWLSVALILFFVSKIFMKLCSIFLAF